MKINKLWKIRRDSKQQKHKTEFRINKKRFYRIRQGVSKRDLGLYHLYCYSPIQFTNFLNDLTNEFKTYRHVIAPRIFSIVDNTEEFLSFVHEIQQCFKNREKVFVDMSNIEKLSDDAIVILLSNMVRFRENHIKFNGNFPNEKNAKAKLKKSGFFKALYKAKKENGYSVNTMNKTIYTHGNVKADSAFSSKIIEESSMFVWGEPRRCPGIQNTFTELMANTYKHAANYEGGHHWWMSMTKDGKEHKVVYGFVDYGVGIFRSLNNKKPGDKLYGAIQHLKTKFPFVKTNEKIMELILKGELHKTVTKKNNRGKGLPSIFKNFERREIDSLVIITNNVYADVKNSDYHLLNNEFVGTFVTWEMNSSILNIKNKNNE